jgi:hypothetical protein
MIVIYYQYNVIILSYFFIENLYLCLISSLGVSSWFVNEFDSLDGVSVGQSLLS